MKVRRFIVAAYISLRTAAGVARLFVSFVILLSSFAGSANADQSVKVKPDGVVEVQPERVGLLVRRDDGRARFEPVGIASSYVFGRRRIDDNKPFEPRLANVFRQRVQV